LKTRATNGCKGKFKILSAPEEWKVPTDPSSLLRLTKLGDPPTPKALQELCGTTESLLSII